MRLFSTITVIWDRALAIERDFGTTDSQLALLQKATEAQPDLPHFWLKLGRFHEEELCDFEGAISVLEKARAKQPKGEEILLALVLLHRRANSF